MYDSYKLYKNILCIDIKAFYASVEANERNLDIFKDWLVVTDPDKGEKAITLAATPALKKKGVNSRTRIFQIPKNILKDTIIAKPQMKKYMEISSELYSFYCTLFDSNDIYVYSIDEVFIDVTNYLNFYKTTPFKLALAIKRKVLSIFNLHVCVGIGQNMVMAKYALDIESKHTPHEIAIWTYEDIEKKLWPITDLKGTWGIGRQTQKRLHLLNIFSMKDLANSNLKVLYKHFGVLGVDLSMHANGVDHSILQQQKDVLEERKSVGASQVFASTYNADTIEVILLEMVFEVILKLQKLDKRATGISIYIGEDKKSLVKGFNVRKKINTPFNSYNEIKDEFISLLRKHISKLILIKRINISVFDLTDKTAKQLDLFNTPTQNKKTEKLDKAIFNIKRKYGKDKIMLALSKTDEGTQYARNKLIGGHNAVVEKDEE